MNVSIIGKTILVFEKLPWIQRQELCSAIKQMEDNYDSIIRNMDYKRITIPIRLKESGKYLCLIDACGTTTVAMYKNEKRYLGNPIINGDDLYNSINLIKNSSFLIQERINASKIYWIIKVLEGLPNLLRVFREGLA